MGEIFIRFLKRFLLICMIGLLVSDIVIFKMRRPKFFAALIALIACLVGAIVGDLLGVLFASLIHPFIKVNQWRCEGVGLFIASAIFMVLSYNLAYRWFKW